MIGLLPLLCGAFIARTDGLRYNDALQFVVVRDGTHTIVSVQNTYRGPVEDFALLVPVPAVLHEGDVKTLDRSVFDAFEGLTGPLLTELDERDPCEPDDDRDGLVGAGAPGGRQGGAQVTVESQFAVGEYDVAVLSATESTALDNWLTDNGYKIPPALATQLRPYIEDGSKFFVAKVDPKRLKMTGGTATLSPLRFAYDAPELRLPLRLSAASSPGVQDVIVFALAPGNQEFSVANRPTIRIPSNLDLTADAAARFPAFYATLFARTLARQPDAAVVEYVGQAGAIPRPALAGVGAGDNANDLGLTRLHFQVRKDGKLDDVVLTTSPIREWFHAAYNRKTRWTGAIRCSAPKRDRWQVRRTAPQVATRADQPLGPLDTLVESDIPALGIKAPPLAEPKKSGCGCASNEPSGLFVVLLALIGRRPGRPGSRAPRARRRTAAPSRSPRTRRP